MLRMVRKTFVFREKVRNRVILKSSNISTVINPRISVFASDNDKENIYQCKMFIPYRKITYTAAFYKIQPILRFEFCQGNEAIKEWSLQVVGHGPRTSVPLSLVTAIYGREQSKHRTLPALMVPSTPFKSSYNVFRIAYISIL